MKASSISEIILPVKYPKEIPQSLHDNIDKITIPNLKVICTRWSIPIRKKHKKKELIQVIRNSFTEILVENKTEVEELQEVDVENKTELKGEREETITTYRDLFQHLKVSNYTEDKFLSWINQGDIEKGYKQEAVSILMLYSRMDRRFSGYVPYDTSAFANGTLKKIDSLDSFFATENIRKGGSQADLVLINASEGKILAFSSKNFASPKGIGSYDISDIKDLYNVMHAGKHVDKYVLEIGIVCRDEKQFRGMEANSKSSSDFLKGNYVIVDQKRLWRMWCNFIKIYPNMENLDEKILKIKNDFVLRFGQRVICNQVAIRIQAGENVILNGSDCRFGKSYCMAQDVLSSNSDNILFLTSQPKTISSIEEIFRKYDNFSKYGIFNLNTPLGMKQFESKPCPKKIILISIQTIRNKLNLNLGNIEMVIIDEFHESGLTEITHDVFLKHKLNKCIKIFYTATFSKVKSFYRIPNENIFVWNLEDNQLAAKKDWKSLQQRHKTVNVMDILGMYDEKEVSDYYDRMVSFNFILTHPSNKCITDFQEINSTLETKYHGYSWKSVSMLSSKGIIKTPEAVVNYFQLFFGRMESTKGGRRYESDAPYTIKKYLDICHQIGQRTDVEGNPLIIPIYMGQVLKEGNTKEISNIDKLSHEVRNLLIKRAGEFIEPLNNYKIVIYNSITNDITLGNESLETGFERLSVQNRNKAGIILLLGTALSTGVTNKYCDLIKLNCEIKSYERFYQTISRARNEAPVGQVKKYAFIAADNYQGIGCLRDLIPYYRQPGESSKTTFSRMFKQKLINITGVNPDRINDVEFTNLTEDRIYSNLKNTRGVVSEFNHLIGNINFNWDMVKYNSVLKCINGKLDKKQTELLERVESIREKQTELLERAESIMEKQIDGVKEGVEEVTVENENVENKEEKLTADEVDKVDKIKKKSMKEAVKHMLLLISLFSVDWHGKKLEDLIVRVKTEKIFEGNTVEHMIKSQLVISFPKLEGKTSDGTPKVDILWVMAESLISLEYHRDEVEIIIEELKETFKSRISDMKKLYIEVEQVIKPTDEAKSMNAEILTPLSLAQSMINKIPPEFWTSPKKIFEPTCGKGVFICLVYDKFLKAGLDKQTIMQECLYFADLNPVNVYICKFILDPFSEYKLNYYVGDTLSLDVENEWKETKGNFDLVIGNPPYQNSCGNKGRGNTLWDKFVNSSLKKWLCKDGYLLFVHPQGWRQIYNKTGKLMLSKQILYLNMNDVNEGQKVFGCSTTFDYYVLQNTEPFQETIINDYKNKEYSFDLKNMRFIPNHSILDINQYLDYKNENGIIADKSTYETRRKWVSKTKTEEFKYPCVYSIKKSNELSLRYSSINTKGHFGITKFIVSNGSGFYKDVEGKYGCTEWSYYIKCDVEDMNNIEKCFQNQEFLNVIDAVKLTSNKYNYSILKYLRKDFWKEFV
jgi:hypothetical protein